MRPVFFETQARFRKWLTDHHASERELWVGFYKKGTGRPSITYPEALDEALCFGWIDGIRKSIDAESYTNRFTPRKASSNWSDVNIRRIQELIEDGRVTAAGRQAFDARKPDTCGAYSFEQRTRPEFDEVSLKTFRANKAAWAFFEAQPPGYRRVVTWWVVSAKRDATRASRLKILIDDSAAGRRIDLMRPRGGEGRTVPPSPGNPGAVGKAARPRRRQK
jgi:uncharacterized protein YdeI (YjbR/CyaY-like superfamily)